MNTRMLSTFTGVLLGVASVSADSSAPMVWFDMKDVSGSTVADASGNGHTLTLGPSVTVVDDGLVGKALKVTGCTGDYATFSCPAVTNTTIAFWVRRDATDGSVLVGGAEKNTIPYILSTGYSGFGINYARNTLQIALINQQNDPQSNFTGTSPARGEWRHLAFALEYADDGAFGRMTCRTYLDGVLVATSAQTNNKPMRQQSTQSVVLLNSAANGQRPTAGLYADFRFYDTCLDATAIKELAAKSVVKRLVMRYAFEEIGSATDAEGRHATPEETGLSSDMTLGTNMTLVDDGVDGKALRFMGTTEIGGWVTAPSFPIAERTYSVWVRSSSRRTEMDAVSDNPFPRLFSDHCDKNGEGGGYCIFSDSKDLSREFRFIPSGCGTTFKTYVRAGVADLDTWSHLAVVEHRDADGNGIADVYVNGEAVTYASHITFPFKTVKGSVSFGIGNSTIGANRYFCGDLDEFRLYNYALSSNEVRRLYRGLARIDAGADFTVAGSKGVLHGTVAAHADDGYRKGYAGEASWSLVSGEGATILQPDAAETEVTLPAPGTYVFRLSITDLGVTKSDDVTVTCVAADPANQAPTVSVAASAAAITLPDFVTLTAAVADDARPAPAKTRVRWEKVSGPGGVWFSPAGDASATVRFGAAGTYVLAATADDGQATDSATVTVAVADRTDGQSLGSGLLHSFSLDGPCDPYFSDGGSVAPKKILSAPNYTTRRHLPGKVGNGARAYAYCGDGAYWTTGAALGEAAIDDPEGAYGGVNLPPKNDYLSISAWIYIDPADTNLVNGKICGASLVGQSHTFGLRYNEKFSPTAAVNEGGFTLYQQGRVGSTGTGGIGMCMVHYPVPNPSPVGRWMHICGILARNASDTGLWEMWYDGVRQTATATTGAGCRGRVVANAFNIGGMPYTSAEKNKDGSLNAIGSYNANWPVGDSLTEFYSRTFPGIVDEVRIWTRKLTPGEIRSLAAHPILDENDGPSLDRPTSVPTKPVALKAAQIRTVAFADKLPEGGSLTFAWSVLSANAGQVWFGDSSAASTTFTALAAGTYVLQLKVSDGERTVCSKPLTIEVQKAGFKVIVR